MIRSVCRVCVLACIVLCLSEFGASQDLSLFPYGPANPTSMQLEQYKSNNQFMPLITLSNGAPVADILNSKKATRFGSVLLEDITFVETLQHFVRERIPERAAHGKGAGALGYFTCTNDVSQYTAASLFSQVGKKTSVAVRFSSGSASLGTSDTFRDIRGIAVKFYTDEGNWDLLTVNFPTFFVRDPTRFLSFFHARKPNPATNVADPTAFWDIISLLPESLPAVMDLYSSIGLPKSYTTMHGYSVNSFFFIKSDGTATLVKFHLLSNQGVVNLTPERAAYLAGRDPDYYTRDLYNAIAKGKFPSWNLTAELMTVANMNALGREFVFDPTKLWPRSRVTFETLGVVVLNENPLNQFSQVEQLGFSPSRLVRGLDHSPDVLLTARLYSYTDALAYRLGSNNQQIPINRPIVNVANGYRDSSFASDDNQGEAPNYFPNSFNGAKAGGHRYRRLTYPVSGLVKTYNTTEQDNYSLPSKMWAVLSEKERDGIAYNIGQELINTPKFIQERAISIFSKASPDWGNRVAAVITKLSV